MYAQHIKYRTILPLEAFLAARLKRSCQQSTHRAHTYATTTVPRPWGRAFLKRIGIPYVSATIVRVRLTIMDNIKHIVDFDV